MGKGAMQYVAHCKHCFASRSLKREQIETGQNLACDGCGSAMVVYSLTGAAKAPAVQELAPRAAAEQR